MKVDTLSAPIIDSASAVFDAPRVPAGPASLGDDAMTIKLRFDPHSNFPTARVWTEETNLEPVAAMLDSDLQTPEDAREWAERLRRVVAGTEGGFAGSGNAFYCDVTSEESHVGLDGEAPATVSVSTKELIIAVEEWAAHLERLKSA